jgi:hypothetical protein
MAKELDLPGPFEVDPATGKPVEGGPATGQAAESRSGGGAPEVKA